MNLELPTWLQPLFAALGARFVWAFLTLILLGLFTAYVDRRKFAGKWRLTINWSAEHAKKLLGSDLPEPHSVGDVAITYGHGPENKDYWGLGYFELHSGTTLYARLCIELADMQVRRRFFTKKFPYFFRLALTQLQLRSRIREKAVDFNYGPWANYRMEFDSSSGDCLLGHMVLVETGEKVGQINARRTA